MKILKAHFLGHIGFWAAALIIAMMGVGLFDAITFERKSLVLNQHAVRFLDDVSGFSEAFVRARAAHGSYLLLGQMRFLERRDAEVLAMRQRLERLKATNDDRPYLRERLVELERLVDERLRNMSADEALLVSDPAAAAGAWARPAHEQSTASITRLIADLRQHELKPFEARGADQQRVFTSASRILMAGVVISITLMLPGYVAFIRQGRARSEAERRLFDLTESLPGAVFQYRIMPDGRARYEFLSSGVKALRGVDREAALENPEVIQAGMLEEDRTALLEAIAAAARTLTPLEHDYRIKGPDGRVRWIRSTSAPRRQPDGSILWSGHWGDVTDRLMLKKALLESKEAAEAANQAKTTFVATMSHEIRTPMNGVLGMLELIRRTGLDDEQRRMLQIVQDSGKSLLRIIDDILDFSKIEAGKLEIAVEPVSTSTLVKSISDVYTGIARNKGLELTVGVDERISPALMADPLRMRQVLGNLLSNAVKFTSAGQVQVRADLIDRSPGREVVRFSVKDTGIGIPVAAQKLLFRPYAQALAGTAHQYGGTGLGLAICQRLATLMGGAIGVVSEPGKGTTMMLTLPLAVAEPVVANGGAATNAGSDPGIARRAAPPIEVAEAERTLVLVADDHPVNLMILTRQVDALGYAVESATNGLEALDKWRSGRFALLITDCDMPEMDGYDLARNIRELEEANQRARAPIIAYTAYATLGMAETCLAAGMDDYLSKPVGLEHLAAKLDRWLPLPAALAKPSRDDARDPVDRSALYEVTGGDPGVARDLMRRFHACAEEDLAELREAVRAADFEETRRLAHRLNGAGRTVGAGELADACEQVEDAGRAGDVARVRAGMESLERQHVRLTQYLSSHERP